MKLLRLFELIALVMVITGVVVGLGRAAVDAIVDMAARPVTATALVYAPTEAEREAFLPAIRQHQRLMEKKIRADIEAQTRPW